MTTQSPDAACENTDRELWRERFGDFYADSIHVTERGGIGINCGGHVIVKPLREWHALAARAVPAVENASGASCSMVASGAEAGPNDIVGHKTFRDGPLGFRHEPLRRSEADAIMASVEAATKRRNELMPDESAARHMLFDAWLRLKDFGWREACYCPKDGSEFDIIEPGSTGVFRCIYEGEWPDGRYWSFDEHDSYPSSPVLYRASEPSAGAAVQEAAKATSQDTPQG